MSNQILTINEIQALVENNRKRYTQILLKKFKNTYDFIDNNNAGQNFAEKLYTYCFGTRQCLCGAPLVFLDFFRGFREFCSKKCMYANVKERREKTVQVKYGVRHYSQTDTFKDKFKSTMFEKYGVCNPFQIQNDRIRTKQLTFFNNLCNTVSDYTEPLFSFEEYNEVRETKLWKCKLCNINFESHVFNKIPKCPICFPTAQYGGQSNFEKEVITFLRNTCKISNIVENTRDLIPPKEIDIYLPDYNIGIECCGLYWHSDKFVDKRYHLQKLENAERLKIHLITIFDDQWNFKTDIVKNRLLSVLNLQPRIFARKLSISEISTSSAKEFLESHHLFGYSASNKKIGLFENDMLVGVMTFTLNRFNNKGWEISRYASVGNIIGGFSKLLKYFINLVKPEIIFSYADRCWTSIHKNVYSAMNFTFDSCTKPNYWYWDKSNSFKRYNRLSFTKQKLIKLGHDPSLTEFEIMESNYYRTWDCGSLKYRLEL